MIDINFSNYFSIKTPKNNCSCNKNLKKLFNPNLSDFFIMVSSKNDSSNESGIKIETGETNFRSNKSDSKKVMAQHPIELEYWFILPAIRRAVAQTLKEGGLKQKQVAHILGITEAGVSQYLKGSRGVLRTKKDIPIQFPEWLTSEIQSSCTAILGDPDDHNNFLKEINRLLMTIRSRPSDFLCMLHNEYGIVDQDCDVCINN